jgi:hypothetical protein
LKNSLHLIAQLAETFGILDKVAYRNICIKIEFDEMISRIPGVQERIIFLTEKYFLSYERIKALVYPRGEAKEIAEQLETHIKIAVTQKQRRIEPRRK